MVFWERFFINKFPIVHKIILRDTVTGSYSNRHYVVFLRFLYRGKSKAFNGWVRARACASPFFSAKVLL